MAVTSRSVAAPPEAVFAILEDGWSYSAWVVGTAKIRNVEDPWPSAGSKIHHAVGVWPLLLQDTTTSITYLPGRQLALRARAWPAGEATVEIHVHPDPERAGCVIVIDERVSAGPAAWIPRPVSDALINIRNKETLRRLAALSEGRHRLAQHAPRARASRSRS